MRRHSSTASRLIPITALLLGCTAGRGGPSHRPSTDLSTRWSAPECFIADTTAPTADTLYVIGARSQRDETFHPSFDCAEGQRSATANTTAPVIVSMEMPVGADLRDILDVGLVSAGGRRPDVVVTRLPDVVDYAVRRGGYLTSALPWSATYMLVGARVSAAPSPAQRAVLARDAVTADARGAAEPFPWLSDTSCAAVAVDSSSDPHAPVAYAAGDVTARQLSERVLSLAGTSPRPAWLTDVIGERGGSYDARLRIAAMPADSLTSALATGRAVAVVMSIARDPLAHCGTKDDSRVPTGAVPLIDTRAHVIVRRGSGAAFLVKPGGSLRFVRQRQR